MASSHPHGPSADQPGDRHDVDPALLNERRRMWSGFTRGTLVAGVAAAVVLVVLALLLL